MEQEDDEAAEPLRSLFGSFWFFLTRGPGWKRNSLGWRRSLHTFSV